MKRFFILVLLPLTLLGQSAYNPVFIGGGTGGGGNVSDPPINPKDYGAFGDGASHTISASDITANASKWRGRIQRTVTDGAVPTDYSFTITSATANFQPCDKGALVIAPNFTSPYLFVTSVVNSTTITVNQQYTLPATTGMTVTLVGYAAGDQWDYVGVQEAFLAAFGGPSDNATGAPNANWTPYHGNTNSWKNKAIHIPQGNYNINKPIVGLAVVGFRIYGDGKLATMLHCYTTDQLGVFLFNGVAYGSIENLAFTGGPSAYGLLNFEATAGFTDTLQPQQISVYSCGFFGNYAQGWGVGIGPWSGNQGDTFTFYNCYFSQFTYAGLNIYNYNALGIVVHGGDFQSNYKYGIACNSGQVLVDGTSFQAGLSLAQTLRYKAADVNIIAPGSNTDNIIRNVRSESWCLSRGVEQIENSWMLPATLPRWAASHAYSVGDLVASNDGHDAFGCGRVFICTVAGTSGATEPAWPSDDRHWGYYDAVNINSGSASLSTGTTSIADNSITVWIDNGDAVIVHGAGTAGADLITHVNAGGGGGGPFTLANTASTTVTNAAFVWGTEATDGGAKWIDYDFFSVINSRKLTDSTFYFGKVLPSLGASGASMERNRMARTDYIPKWYREHNFGSSRYFEDKSNLPMTSSFGLWGNGSYATNFGGTWYGSKFDLAGKPLVFRLSDNGWEGRLAGGYSAPEIGFVRADQAPGYGFGDPATDTRNMIAVVGTLGAALVPGTNVAGQDLRISGGPGTGSGGGGSLRFYTQPAGSSGTSIPNIAERMSIGNTGRVNISTAMRLAPVTFSSAIASPLEGDLMYFTDSTTATHAATITGGGANHVVGVYTGAAWKVFYP
jgi:hypothetical protein